MAFLVLTGLFQIDQNRAMPGPRHLVDLQGVERRGELVDLHHRLARGRPADCPASWPQIVGLFLAHVLPIWRLGCLHAQLALQVAQQRSNFEESVLDFINENILISKVDHS